LETTNLLYCYITIAGFKFLEKGPLLGHHHIWTSFVYHCSFSVFFLS